MPIAIECGMPLDDFWYSDEDLFESYLKAYNTKLSREAWMHGIYTLRAVESAINNVMPVAIGYALGNKKIKFEPLEYYKEPIDLSDKTQTHEKPEIQQTADPDTLFQLQLKSFNL